jgi:hypothetical protein
MYFCRISNKQLLKFATIIRKILVIKKLHMLQIAFIRENQEKLIQALARIWMLEWW